MKKLEGLVAAPFTAFDSDGELNLPTIEKQVEMLLANDVRGALVCGTTGEAGSITLKERMRIVECWCDVAPADFPVIVHVGHSCLKDSQTLAAHAARAGAYAIAALPPYYFKPSSVEVLVEHCREIARTAPKLPFYYYHLPSITGVTLPVIDLLRAMGETIPNFAGIKFTYEDLYDFGLCLEFANRKYDVLCGRDEVLLAGLALGASGAVGSTYNYMAPIFHQVIAAYQACDMPKAQAAQERARSAIELMVRFGGLPAAKAMMRMIGIDCGPVRLPLKSLLVEQYESLQSSLDEIGFFDFCSRPLMSPKKINEINDPNKNYPNARLAREYTT